MIEIRVALPGEVGALEAVQMRASLANPGDRDAILAHPDAVSIPLEQFTNGWVFAAVDDDQVIGFAAVFPRADGDWELDGLFVEPTVWRSGVGRQLVEYAATYTAAAGSSALRVIGNPHAEAFYHACGFTTVGAGDTRFGPSILMRLVV